MPAKQEIIYPIFLECCQYAEDDFWDTIFMNLAYGKTPYGTYINKGFLTCSYKNKEFSYKIERKDSRVLYNDVYSLLKDKLGILSQKEKTKKIIEFHNAGKEIEKGHTEWSSIRKKNIKDILYEKYTIDMKNKYNLDLKQCKVLLSTILIYINFKIISSKDIEYKDGKIVNIKGIKFSNGKFTIERDSHSGTSNTNENTETVTEQKCMMENWYKYLKQNK